MLCAAAESCPICVSTKVGSFTCTTREITITGCTRGQALNLRPGRFEERAAKTDRRKERRDAQQKREMEEQARKDEEKLEREVCAPYCAMRRIY